MQRLYGRLADSRMWPKPRKWHATRRLIDDCTDSKRLYRVAAEEFGILQVEKEITSFLDYVAEQGPCVVVEIGVKFGGTAFLILRRFLDLELYVGVDLKLENVGKLIFHARKSQRLCFIEGNAHSDSVIQQAGRLLGEQQVDFLLIDGDHSYEGALADFISWYRLVRPGGLIAFHDIVPDEVARFGVNPEDSVFSGGEVYRLWRQVVDHFEHHEFVEDWSQFGYGIGVLIKPDQDAAAESLLSDLRQSSSI